VHKCLDVKSQRWAHACNIFIIEFFQYGSLPGIVKTAAPGIIWTRRFPVDVDDLQKQQSHLLLLLPVLPYYSEQPHKKVESSGEVRWRDDSFGTAVTVDGAGSRPLTSTVYFLPPLR